MSVVTIEGSLSPSTYLARGQRRTVQRTPDVEKLIAGGFVVVVDEGEPPALTLFDVEPEDASEPGIADAPPARNASRGDWAEYLEANTEIVTEGKTRDELIREWDDVADEGVQ